MQELKPFDEIVTLREVIESKWQEHIRHRRQTIETAWELGELLNRAKANIAHGKFHPFLETLKIPPRTATHYMRFNEQTQIGKIADFGSVDEALKALSAPEPKKAPEPDRAGVQATIDGKPVKGAVVLDGAPEPPPEPEPNAPEPEPTPALDRAAEAGDLIDALQDELRAVQDELREERQRGAEDKKEIEKLLLLVQATDDADRPGLEDGLAQIAALSSKLNDAHARANDAHARAERNAIKLKEDRQEALQEAARLRRKVKEQARKIETQADKIRVLTAYQNDIRQKAAERKRRQRAKV